MARKRTERLPSFETVCADRMEPVRWLRRWPIIGPVQPVSHSEGTQPTTWPSWEAWTATYRNCRSAFLEWAAGRSDREPVAEELLRAFDAGGEDACEAVVERLVEAERAADPRLRGLA